MALASAGYWMLFSNFATHDDEGYILISARQYLAHGKLYEGVYSQYGPAFYWLTDLLQRVTGPADHTLARFLTLGLWLGSAVCSGGIVWRHTGSRSLTLFTLSAVFIFLHLNTGAPFHPGILIIFVLAASLWAASELITADKLTQAASLMGATGALLVLTKINVGAFYLMAVVTWAAGHASSDKLRRWSAPIFLIILSLFACALMHTLIRESWVQIYLALFVSGTFGLLFTSKGESLVGLRPAVWFSIAGLITAVVVLTSIWLRGTSFSGLIEGVLLGPLRHPTNYSYPVDWRPGSLVVAFASLGLACGLPWLQRRNGTKAADRIIIVVRLTASLALLVAFAVLINLRAIGAIFSYVAPLIWIWTFPLSSQQSSRQGQSTRSLLATVLLLQYLHAYPVGGAQESWGGFLFIPLVALGLGDVRHWLSTQPASAGIKRFAWATTGSIFAVIVAAKTGSITAWARGNFAAQPPLNLPGAAGLHLPPLQRATYRILALNAVVHADTLFSLPGMFSFNLWTGLPAPTDKNTTLWFNLLNDGEQQEIIEKCEATSRVGLIVHEDLLALMEANQIRPQGILWNYLQKNFIPAFRSGGFTFWTKQSQPIIPINLATVRSLNRTSSPGTQDLVSQLDFSTVSDGTAIAGIEFSNTVTGEFRTIDARNAQATFADVSRDGRQLSSPVATNWPLQRKGLVHYTVMFNRENFPVTPANTLIFLKGSNGETLGELRIAE